MTWLASGANFRHVCGSSGGEGGSSSKEVSDWAGLDASMDHVRSFKEEHLSCLTDFTFINS
jgi:hypothetical protein